MPLHPCGLPVPSDARQLPEAAAHCWALAEEISWPRAQAASSSPQHGKQGLCAIQGIPDVSQFSRGLPIWDRAPRRSLGPGTGSGFRGGSSERFSTGLLPRRVLVSCLGWRWGALSREPVTPHGLGTSDERGENRDVNLERGAPSPAG